MWRRPSFALVLGSASYGWMIVACGSFGGTDVPDARDGSTASAADGATATLDGQPPGDTASPPTPDAPASDGVRIVFTTKAMFDGNMGGIEGADEKCNAAARASKHARVNRATFAAWLSTKSSNALARLGPAGARVAKTPDGTMVARTWDEFTSSAHLALLNIDENGEKLADTEHAWTATDSTGAFVEARSQSTTCEEFRGTGSDAITGDPEDKGARWTNAGGQSCAAPSHLYCVEY